MFDGRLVATQQRELFFKRPPAGVKPSCLPRGLFWGECADLRYRGNLRWSESSPDCLLAD